MSIAPTGLSDRLTTVRAQFETMRGTLRTKLDTVRSQFWSRTSGLGLSGLGGTGRSPIKTYQTAAAGPRLLQRLGGGRKQFGGFGGPFYGGLVNNSGTTRTNFPGRSNSGLQRGPPPITRTPIMSYATPIKTYEQGAQATQRTPIRTY